MPNYATSSDLAHSVVKETTFGETPTAGTRYEIPASADQEPLKATATKIASPTKRPNRESNGSRDGATMIEGSYTFPLIKHALVDMFFENALCGTFTSDVLKGGELDQSFTVFNKLANGMYRTNAGCAVTGFSISAKGNEDVKVTFDLIGSAQTRSATDNALTKTSISGTTEFVSREIGTITIAGQELKIAQLDFSTKLDKNHRFALGSDASLTYGVSGTRETILTVKAYRESFAIDDAITGGPQACVFSIGEDGYSFEMPAAYGTKPTDSISDGSLFVDLTFTAGYDETAGTGLVITRIAPTP